MKSGIRWKFDGRKPVSAKLRHAAVDALGDFAEYLLDETNQVVPLEEATLQRSGAVEVDRERGVAQITYDTPYARVQHEDTTLRHDAGRKAKYLEDTVNQNAAQFGPFVADRMRKAL